MANNEFFLEPDEAETMGDIKYMKRSVKVRKTFPKTLKNPEGFAIEKEFSATEGGKVSPKSNVVAEPAPVAAPTPAPAPAAASAPVAVAATTSSAVPTLQERRKGDPGVNRFRDMARNIATRGRY